MLLRLSSEVDVGKEDDPCPATCVVCLEPDASWWCTGCRQRVAHDTCMVRYIGAGLYPTRCPHCRARIAADERDRIMEPAVPNDGNVHPDDRWGQLADGLETLAVVLAALVGFAAILFYEPTPTARPCYGFW